MDAFAKHALAKMIEMQTETPALSDRTLGTSEEFIGRWNDLISTTNWDKGRIIAEWREALVANDAPSVEYSDDAWSRLVGNVTPQHVGRLRRVYQRFEADRVSFEGLYWSHFCAALEWDDAEMWLEGALQNTWSVSRMRRQRWETLGSIPAEEPRAEDVVATEPAEENILTPQDLDAEMDLPPELTFDSAPVEVDSASADVLDANEPAPSGLENASADSATIYSGDPNPVGKFVQSFEDLAELPEDVTQAFEQYKQVILHHKTSGWELISKEDMLAGLESLKSLVVSA